MQPSEANLRNRAGAAANHKACVAGKSHEQISSVAHTARNKHTAGPVFQANIVRGNDAHHQPSACQSALCRDARGRTSAAAYECNTEAGEQCAGGRS